MKSELIKENETEQEIVFPCLMHAKTTTLVVMANKPNGGTFSGQVMIEDTISPKGLLYNFWDSQSFYPLPKGQKIILEND